MASREFNTPRHTHITRKLQPTRVIDTLKRRHQPSGLIRRRPLCGSLSESVRLAGVSRNLTAYYVQHQPNYDNSAGSQLPNQIDTFGRKQMNESGGWARQNNIQVYSLHQDQRTSERSKKVSKSSKPKSKVPCIPDFLTCKQKSPKKASEMKSGSKKDSKTTSMKSKRSTPKASDASKKQMPKSPKLSWDDKVKVRYVDSDLLDKRRRKLSTGFQGELPGNENKDENVVHLKIYVPKPDESPKKANDTKGQENGRILNILREELLTNATLGKSEPMTVEEAGAIIKLLTKNEPENPKLPAPTFAQQRNPNVDYAYTMSNVIPGDNGESNVNGLITYPPGDILRISSPTDDNSFGAYGKTCDTVEKLVNQKQVEKQTVEKKPVEQKEEKPPVIYKDIGVSVKQEQKVSEVGSESCTCRNTANPNPIFEKIRNSINMTDSDNAVFDKIINPSSDPAYTGKRTKHGNVTVETHNPICDCEICTSFGTVELAPTSETVNDNDGLVISEKVVRVLHNNGYRNIVTHTESCNCKICKSIKEHTTQSPVIRNYQVSHAVGNDTAYNRRYSRNDGRNSDFHSRSHDEHRRSSAKEPKMQKSFDSGKVTHKLVVPHCCATDLLKHYRPPVRHSTESRRKEDFNERKGPPLVASSSDNSDSSEDNYSSISPSRGSIRHHHNNPGPSKPFDYSINRAYDDRGSNAYEPPLKSRNREFDEDVGFGESHSDDDDKSQVKYRPKRSSCLSCSSQPRSSLKKSNRKPPVSLHPAIIEESISASIGQLRKRNMKNDHRKSHGSHKSSRSKRKRQSIVNSVRILQMSSQWKLHNIIRDLVKGHPPKKNPNLYTVTLGQLESTAPYSSIKIVNYANPNIHDFLKPGCSPSLPQTSVPQTSGQLLSQTRESCPSVLGIPREASRSPFGCISMDETDSVFHMQPKYSNTLHHQFVCGERRINRPTPCDSPNLLNSGKMTNVDAKQNKLMIRFSKLFKGKSKKS